MSLADMEERVWVGLGFFSVPLAKRLKCLWTFAKCMFTVDQFLGKLNSFQSASQTRW